MSTTPSPKLSVPQILSTISEPWHPKMLARVNNSAEVRIAKLHGKFIWHAHPDTDELFYVLEGGPLMMHIRERKDDKASEKSVIVGKGDVFVVPKGMQHLPEAEIEASVMMIEQIGTLNTGDQVGSDRTVEVGDARK